MTYKLFLSVSVAVTVGLGTIAHACDSDENKKYQNAIPNKLYEKDSRDREACTMPLKFLGGENHDDLTNKKQKIIDLLQVKEDQYESMKTSIKNINKDDKELRRESSKKLLRLATDIERIKYIIQEYSEYDYLKYRIDREKRFISSFLEFPEWQKEYNRIVGIDKSFINDDTYLRLIGELHHKYNEEIDIRKETVEIGEKYLQKFEELRDREITRDSTSVAQLGVSNQKIKDTCNEIEECVEKYSDKARKLNSNAMIDYNYKRYIMHKEICKKFLAADKTNEEIAKLFDDIDAICIPSDIRFR